MSDPIGGCPHSTAIKGYAMNTFPLCIRMRALEAWSNVDFEKE